MRRIRQSELQLHQPLPWSLYDSQGNLLLRQGFVLSIPRHVDMLLHRGVYVHDEDDGMPAAMATGAAAMVPSLHAEPAGGVPERHERVPEAAGAASRPDIHAYEIGGRLMQALRRLHLQVQADVTRARLAEQLAQLADMLLSGLDRDRDALLAACHLERQAAYIDVQQVLGAVVAVLAAREAGMAETVQKSLACAALGRDLALLPVQPQLDEWSGPLSDELCELIRRHPEEGARLVRTAGVQDGMWLDVMLHHHERYDGSGYPHGLHGDQLHPACALLAVADSYAAMVTSRANREGRFPQEVLRELYLASGVLYSPAAVRLVVKTLTPYPPGTLVRLHGGEVGVFRNGARSGERPGVWVLYDPSGMPLLRPQARQLDVRKDIAGHVRPETCRSAALILKQLWCKPLEGLTA
ncbi:HD-GYP domain-containing protein [Laribacter hongkongensis]|uniref:HD-GYP domain-containing protein n=1 Tax=Laribacter hongkongensis TaxID=168471 RepID=UPI001877DE32|nr:HD domain-containing phosphohydrolase [Laribacter hongkongensis]